ncbi:MAG TPA: helix-turn-helix domain-containing protein, partial [Synergistetes bacterium]|nr:helix-turn-helix domain-containing protein [Synergistota bacterium]
SEPLAARESIHDINSNNIGRLFRKLEGCTPNRYEAGLRVEKTKKLPAETDASIPDIALQCGFEIL